MFLDSLYARVKNTKYLKPGDELILFQEDKSYYYEIIEILNFNNVSLKLKTNGYIYKEVYLNESEFYIKGSD